MTDLVLRPLEDLPTRSVVAFRFWDPATDRAITDGLAVEAAPVPGGWPSRRAVLTPRGLHALSGLPGALGPERGDASWAEPAPLWWVEVHDLAGRYLPVGLWIDPSRADPGVFVGPGIGGPGSPPASTWLQSPPSTPGAFYLFSSPSRTLSASLAAVRGQLRVEDRIARDDGVWAGHAVVSVSVAGRRWFSVADGEGRFLITFPWPGFQPIVGSPPVATRTPMEAQHWDVDLSVHFEPALLAPPAGGTLPDFRRVVAQRAAEPWPAAPELGGARAPTLAGRLEFGRPLVLRTSGRSSVLVHPR